MIRRYGTHAEHATTTAVCKRCKETRAVHVFVCPDPEHRGQARADREALGWLQSHPCNAPSLLTVNSDNARKRAAAA